MSDRLLVVDDEKIIRESLSFVLRKKGYSVGEAADGKEAEQMILKDSYDLIITDLEMPGIKGIELLGKVKLLNPQTSVIVTTAYGSLETAIAAIRCGASDYILKPVDFDDLLLRIQRLISYKKLSVENQILRRKLHREFNFASIIGKSLPMRKVIQTVSMVASTESTVLITGNSGTGKELIARALHYNSQRSAEAFITVNCGAISESLIESELFGHKKGAFTGASADKAGYFRAADRGTLFLDEISEMPYQLQVKLLRSIDQKEITPVGVPVPELVDVRIIASSNRDLRECVTANQFREDLYYRLNIVEIHLPSLSERRDDIPLLIAHFIEKHRNRSRKPIIGADSEAIHHLMHHEWRGEIRELENIIERAMIFCKGEYITAHDLPEELCASPGMKTIKNGKPLKDAMNELTRRHITAALRRNNHDKEKTARVLKISLPTLYRRIKDLDIKP